MWCKSCRVTGYTHCAHPDECGNMVTLTAAADSWKSWLDDAPLPETFNSATGGLQDFITALSRALLTARAELDTTQTQLGDWIVRADEANVKVETLDAELARVRADAAVAVALMVERAAEQADPWDGPVTKNKIVDAQAIVAQQVKARIRALAPDAGTAELAKLRERAEKAEQERVAEWNRRRDADGSRDAARAACDTMRAERDTLAAENASLKAREKVDANLLLAAYKGLLVLHRMLSKSGLSVGAETATYITDQIAAAHPEMPGLASLRAAPTDPGDGWTWNERLGWIGPDGKPADPRRRG